MYLRIELANLDQRRNSGLLHRPSDSLILTEIVEIRLFVRKYSSRMIPKIQNGVTEKAIIIHENL